MKKQHRRAWIMCSFLIKTKDDSGNSKDVSDDEKAQLKSQAEAIASGLKEGGDLNALAEEQGATVQTLTFDKDTTSPDEDLIKAADALGEGESTDVIETEKGCYVAKVTSLLDRTATDSKKSQIVQERQQSFMMISEKVEKKSRH